MRERAAEAAKKPANERDWTEQRVIERVADYKASSSAPRSCAYCSEGGHNAKGCATRKNDIINAISNTITFRKKFIEALKVNNFGVGAIISYDGYFSGFGYAADNGAPHYLLVKHFNETELVPWNCYNKRSKLDNTVIGQHMKSLNGDYRSTNNVNLPAKVVLSIDPNYHSDYSYSRTQIISGSCETGLNEAQFVSYQSCEAVVKGIFEEKQRSKKVLSRHQLRSMGVVAE
jgi:hypothetical protein